MHNVTPKEFLQTLDKTMAMKNGDWVEDQLEKGLKMVLLDLRSHEAWTKSRIPTSKQVSIQELPDRAASLIPDSDSIVICICNGSVQSAMAVFYLRTEGWEAYNLSGGYSSWEKNSRPLES